MSTGKGQKMMFERYPKFKNLYLTAFQKLIDTRKELGLEVPKKWETPEKLMQWWMQDETSIPETIITQEIRDGTD